MARKKETKKNESPLRRIDVAELHTALADERVPVLVDVRTGFEFRSGHIAGSINLPMGQVETADLPDEVWLICRSGNRSATVAKALVDRGKHVVDVARGTAAWSASGHPLVRSGGGGAWSQLLVPVMASLTLGLAPFLPEPHLVGKIRWVAGGAVGMGPMDWFDLAMHGAPFLWLAWTLVRVLTGGNGKAT